MTKYASEIRAYVFWLLRTRREERPGAKKSAAGFN